MELYQQLWEGAQLAPLAETDPFLLARDADTRKGLSLIYRVSVNPVLGEFLAELARQTPEQYHYPPSDLHVTVLTLIPVGEQSHFPASLIAEFGAAIAPHLTLAPRLKLQGITMTPRAVMIQGFPSSGLNVLRESLRCALGEVGLAEGVDRRYKIVAAHVTVLRFQVQPPDFAALKRYLAAERAQNRDFGEQSMSPLLLTENDYFMQAAKTQTRREFSLQREK